jgi:ankyrin repeat protein
MSLFEAVEKGDIEAVQLLLLKNDAVGINALNSEGESLLMVAAKHGHKQIVQLLLRNGADPNLVTPVNGIPFLVYFCCSFSLSYFFFFGLGCGSECLTLCL